MKYIKKFSHYNESIINEIEFVRFNRSKIPDGILKPPVSEFINSVEKNIHFKNYLIERGFPNIHQCINFMRASEIKDRMTYKSIYGEYEYIVQLQDQKIGWSFFTPINDWYYKCDSQYWLNNVVGSKSPLKFNLLSKHYSRYDNQDCENIINTLIKENIIGTGTKSDLINSELYQQQNMVFVWTTESILIKSK